jgi:hypothetical protein
MGLSREGCEGKVGKVFKPPKTFASCFACADPLELNEEFEAQYDTAEYESKIARLLHNAVKAYQELAAAAGPIAGCARRPGTLSSKGGNGNPDLAALMRRQRTSIWPACSGRERREWRWRPDSRD